jgi:hypothetical protein
MNVIESSRPRTASEGHATVGKKPGTHLIMPLWGGGIEPSPHKDAAYGLEQVSGSVRCRGVPKFDRNRLGSVHKAESRRTSLFPAGFESSC